MQTAKERFNKLDKDKKGHITVNDLRRYFRVCRLRFRMFEDTLHLSSKCVGVREAVLQIWVHKVRPSVNYIDSDRALENR